MAPTLRESIAAWRPAAERAARAARLEPVFEHLGTVERVGDGVASVRGLPETRMSELLRFPSGGYGLATTLREDEIGCILLGDENAVRSGDEVRGTGQVTRVPVGGDLLGRIVDPLGRPLDGGPEIAAERFDPVERSAPAVVDRDLVRRPLRTGLLAVDAMLPLGRGQRELVVGDRATGKTSLAVDAIIAQRSTDVLSVYCAIGQKSSTVKEVVAAVREHGAPERTLFVVAEADASPGLQWLAPYAACSMAEYFSLGGRDALLVLDDLTKHAAVHRELSLLLRTPPGREAYPGDVFYVHSRLLERAAQLAGDQGGGSLTALPIVETQAQNLTAYIPTNLVSITDGQIVLEPRLFYEGQRPAVNIGLSVSRVGGKTQPPAMKELAQSLRLEYAQFLELEVFTRFGGMVVDETTRALLSRGRRIRAALRQSRFDPLTLADEVILLLALEARLLDRVAPEQIGAVRDQLRADARRRCAGAMASLEERGELSEEDRAALMHAIQNGTEAWAS